MHFLLNHTWYRPRDIVRILRRAKESAGGATFFSEAVFDTIGKDYSKFAWIEVKEELNVKFSADEIAAIERILLGFNSHFNFAQFKAHAELLSARYSAIGKLMARWPLIDLLGKLYELGVLGNYYEVLNENKVYVRIGRFAFRGDDTLLPEQEMMIHPALRANFSILH